jgi:hypothetical protein
VHEHDLTFIKGTQMTNINEIYQSNYLTAADLQGKEPTVTITQVEVAKMNDGQAKLCIYVNNKPKGVVLNKTNARAIAALYGDESARWVGKKVKLVTVWTDFQGKPVQAIRIIPPQGDHLSQGFDAQAPVSPPPAQTPENYGAFDDEVPF